MTFEITDKLLPHCYKKDNNKSLTKKCADKNCKIYCIFKEEHQIVGLITREY